MVDNETLIKIFADSSAYLRAQLPDLLAADPPPQVVHRYIEAWMVISSLINELGRTGGQYQPEIIGGSRHFDVPESLIGQLEVITQQLERLDTKLDTKLDRDG